MFITSPGPEFVYTDSIPPICIYWPWPATSGLRPKFAFTLLLVVVTGVVVILAVVVISLDNTNISMPILVN